MGRLRHLTNYYLDEKKDIYIVVNLKTNPAPIGLGQTQETHDSLKKVCTNKQE